MTFALPRSTAISPRLAWRATRIGCLALFVAGCSVADLKPGDSAAVKPTDAVDVPPRADGGPPGSLEDWVSEMRSRLAAVPALFADDMPASQREVIDIYSTRQEFLELYYGHEGRVSAGGALGDAIEKAEDIFHELISMTAANPRPSRAAVETVVQTLRAQLEQVVDLAKAAGVPLVPPDARAPVGSSASGS